MLLGEKRSINRIRRDIVVREVTVSQIEWVGATLLRLTFIGDSLAGFVSDSFDDHIKFIFTAADGLQYRRDYTPTFINPADNTVGLEFAVHAGGKASDWATQAKVGDTAIIAGPKGSMVIPMDYDWHYLVGDESSYPAIQRRLHELPADKPAHVLLKVDDESTRNAITQAFPDIHFVSDNASLIAALKETQLPSGEGFVWCAGESAAMRQARDILIQDKRHPKSDMKVAAYWKEGEADFHDRLV